MYYRFVAPSTGTYYLNVAFEQTVPFILTNEGNYTLSYDTLSGTDFTRYKINLVAGQAINFGYDIGYTSGYVFSFRVTQSLSAVTWYVNGTAVTGNNYYAQQGQSLVITKKLGNVFIDTPLELGATNLGSLSSNTFNVYADAFCQIDPANISFILEPSQSGDEILYNEYLHVYVLPNISVSEIAKTDLSSSGSNEYGYGFHIQGTSLNSTDEFYVSGYFIDGNGTQVANSSFTELPFGIVNAPYIDHDLAHLYVYSVITSIKYHQEKDGFENTITLYNTVAPEYQNQVNCITLPNVQINTLYYSGTGTSTDPYQITNERHLNNIRYATVTVFDIEPYTAITANYVLMNNITLANQWVPIPTIFMGSFKGSNDTAKTIFNVDISVSTYQYATGFFAWIDEATISYITIGGSSDSTYSYTYNSTSNANVIGGLAGVAENSTIQNCIVHVWMTTNSIKGVSGGVVGSVSSSTISYTVVYGSIDSTGTIGGIAGVCANSTLSHVTNNAYIQAKYYNVTTDSSNSSYGGIVGIQYSGGLIQYSSSIGNVSYVSVSSNNRFLKPRMGSLIGTKYGGYIPENCTSNLCTVSKGTLYNVFYWFVYYNQAQYVGGTIGKTS